MQEITCKNRRPFYTNIPTPSIYLKGFGSNFLNSVSEIVFQFMIVCQKMCQCLSTKFYKNYITIASYILLKYFDLLHPMKKHAYYYKLFYAILNLFLYYLSAYFQLFLNLPSHKNIYKIPFVIRNTSIYW